MSEDQTIDTNENQTDEDVEGHSRTRRATGTQQNLGRVSGTVQAEDSDDEDDVEGHKFFGSQSRVLGSRIRSQDENA